MLSCLVLTLMSQKEKKSKTRKRKTAEGQVVRNESYHSIGAMRTNNEQDGEPDPQAIRQKSLLVLMFLVVVFTLDTSPDQLNGLRGGKLVKLPPRGPSESEISALASLNDYVQHLPQASLPFPTNVTGVYSGQWSLQPAYNASLITLPTDPLKVTSTVLNEFEITPLVSNDTAELAHNLGLYNSAGKLKLHLKSMATEVYGIHLVTGVVSFRDGKSYSSHDIVGVYAGAYIVKTGRLTLFPHEYEQEQFLGIELDNSVSTSSSNTNKTVVWDNTGLLSVLDRNKIKADQAKQRKHTPAPKSCKFRVDIQFPMSNSTAAPVTTVTNSPTELVDVAHNVSVSPSVFSGSSKSLNCEAAMVIDAHILNIDIPGAMKKAAHFAIGALAVTAVQSWLILTQLNQVLVGPAQASKLSPLTIGGMALLDWYLCLVYLTSGVVLEKLSNSFTPVAIFKLLLFSILEMRLVNVIWRARNPRDANENWGAALRREMGIVYGRFYAAFVAGLGFIWLFWSFHTFLLVVAFSFWIPQIVQNVVDDVRDPLETRFVLGMTASRLYAPLYFFGCPNTFVRLIMEDNVSLYNPTTIVVVIIWVLLQIGVLELQRAKGARCFVPKQFLPEKYDYYRPIPNNISHSDCVICMNSVSAIDEAAYMVTPCNHLFHAHCLQRWLEVKRDCPTCRTPLPNP